jgi:hypothetical protein
MLSRVEDHFNRFWAEFFAIGEPNNGTRVKENGSGRIGVPHS